MGRTTCNLKKKVHKRIVLRQNISYPGDKYFLCNLYHTCAYKYIYI